MFGYLFAGGQALLAWSAACDWFAAVSGFGIVGLMLSSALLSILSGGGPWVERRQINERHAKIEAVLKADRERVSKFYSLPRNHGR